MRLTTLARKIEKTPNQLMTFLEEKGIDISSGLHGKLDTEIIELVMHHFMPDKKIEAFLETAHENNGDILEDTLPQDGSHHVIADDELETENEVEEIEKIESESIPLEDNKDEELIELPLSETIDQQKSGTVDDLENVDITDIEHIKAKKVKLEGIKVVGKIELPEKPKKERPEKEVKDDEESDEKSPVKQERNRKAGGRGFDRNRKKNKYGRNRAPLSYEERLKKEEREKLQERRKKAKEAKQRKKKYYQKNIQPKITPKNKKKKKHLVNETEQKVVTHKNPFKRLWAWLNGEYDKY